MPNGGCHPRVIVADDHSIVCTALKQLPESLPDITVTAAVRSGRALPDALAQSSVDLTVTDYPRQPADPDGDGLRPTSRLQRIYPEIPVVVFTMVINGAILHRGFA